MSPSEYWVLNITVIVFAASRRILFANERHMPIIVFFHLFVCSLSTPCVRELYFVVCGFGDNKPTMRFSEIAVCKLTAGKLLTLCWTVCSLHESRVAACLPYMVQVLRIRFGVKDLLLASRAVTNEIFSVHCHWNTMDAFESFGLLRRLRELLQSTAWPH